VHRENKVNQGKKNAQFVLNKTQSFQVCSGKLNGKNNPSIIYAMDKLETGRDNVVPLWLFGFLY